MNDALVHELSAAGVRLTTLGLSPGTSGNVSFRSGTQMFISASGVALDELTPENMSVVELAGDGAGYSHVDGPAPSKEAPFHAALYSRDQGNRSVVHLHSPEAVAMSCLSPWSQSCAIPPLTPYLIMRVGRVPLLPYAAPGDERLAQAILDESTALNAALLQNHGSVAAGTSTADAVAKIIEIEEACAVALRISHLPGVRYLTPEEIRELVVRYGQPWVFDEVSGHRDS